MTIDRETVIRLAREARVLARWCEPSSEWGCDRIEELQRFAALILEHGRKPLTDEQIDAVLDEAKVPEYPGCEGIDKLIARAIEAAHGIINKESSDAE